MKKGEKSAMDAEKYWEVTERDWGKTSMLLLLFVTVVSLSSVFLLTEHWYFWFLIVVVGLLSLVIWHTKSFAYRCPRCGKIFEISIIEDLIGPNSVDRKYLKCPDCRKRSWAEIFKIKE
jgi:DNA-directed RNA polymerase subunit RPC12/RpoP